MSPLELVAILALTGYAIYTQTKVTEITGGGNRFKLALIYGVVGLAVGGFDLPSGPWGWGMLAFGLALSAVVGLARGYKTNIWRDADGRIFRKGNALTISLFLALVASKFVLGTVAYFNGIDDGAGFGEILVMIAIMVAFQAQIMWTRAQALGAGSDATTQDRQRV